MLTAARDGVLRHGLRNRLGRAHDVLRKGFREPVGPDDGENVDARIIDMAEDLGDDTLRTVLRIAVVHDLHDDLVFVHGVHVLALRDVDVLQDPLVVRLDEADGFILMIKADDFLVGMLEDLGDVALGAVARVCTSGDDDAHAVAVERLTDVIGRDEDVRLIFVALHRHEAEATWMRMEGTDMCEIFCAAILSLLGDADAAFRYETVQHLLEGGTLRLRNPDQHGHFLRFHRLIDRILHEIHDQLGEFFLLIILHKIPHNKENLHTKRMQVHRVKSYSSLPDNVENKRYDEEEHSCDLRELLQSALDGTASVLAPVSVSHTGDRSETLTLTFLHQNDRRKSNA